jgi:predicted lipoprotein with Yx(FWY)xxD motif
VLTQLSKLSVNFKGKGAKVKKSNSIIIVVIILVVIIGGGYAIFHKSKKATAPTTSSSTQSNTSSVNNAVLTTKTSATLGKYLAAPNGNALYTYANDTTGVSNCTGSCLSAWPAYQDTGSTTNLPQGVGTIKRTDNGQTQYTYNGKPLYFFASDPQGQVTGNGVSSFSVATPAASAPQTTTTSPTTTPAPATNSTSSNNAYNY